jgi:hypothetical protein
MKHLSIITLLSLYLVLFSNYSCLAGETESKTAIYTDFFEVTGAEKQYMQARSLIANQITNSFLKIIEQSMKEDNELSDEKRLKINALLEQFMNDSVQSLMNQYDDEIPFSELVNKIFIPIYEEHFTLDEIKDVTSYYKSPTGKKFAMLAPLLMQNTVNKMNHEYGKKLQEISLK